MNDFSQLCSANQKFTDKLFGDDLPGNLKDMTAVNRVMKVVANRNRGGSGFRGRGGFPRGGGRGNQHNFNPQNHNQNQYPNKPVNQSHWRGGRGSGRGRGNFQRK